MSMTSRGGFTTGLGGEIDSEAPNAGPGRVLVEATRTGGTGPCESIRTLCAQRRSGGALLVRVRRARVPRNPDLSQHDAGNGLRIRTTASLRRAQVHNMRIGVVSPEQSPVEIVDVPPGDATFVDGQPEALAAPGGAPEVRGGLIEVDEATFVADRFDGAAARDDAPRDGSRLRGSAFLDREPPAVRRDLVVARRPARRPDGLHQLRAPAAARRWRVLGPHLEHRDGDRRAQDEGVLDGAEQR